MTSRLSQELNGEANLDQAAIAHLLSESHCLVHPSLWESFGVVVLEALAAGCAVITTDIASPRDGRGRQWTCVGHARRASGRRYLIPEFGNPGAFARLLDRLSLHRLEDALAGAMFELVADPVLMARHQRAARAVYTARFSREVWRERMREDLRASISQFRLL